MLLQCVGAAAFTICRVLPSEDVMKKRLSFGTRVFIIVSLLLLAANITPGALMTIQSSNSMKTQIQQRMLDISNTAAATLDGDDSSIPVPKSSTSFPLPAAIWKGHYKTSAASAIRAEAAVLRYSP